MNDEHKSDEQVEQANRESQADSEKNQSLEHPPAGPGAESLGNTTTLAAHSSPAEREETKEEVSGEKAVGVYEKKNVDFHVTPSPFAKNEERELFTRDPEEYQRRKLAGPGAVEVLSEDDRTILEGPGTRQDAIPGTAEYDALNEQRLKAAQEHKHQQEEAKKN